MAERRKNLREQPEAGIAGFETPNSDIPALRQSEAALADMARLRKLFSEFLSGDEQIRQRLDKTMSSLAELPPEEHYTIADEIIILTQLVKRGLKDIKSSSPNDAESIQKYIDELKNSWHHGITNAQASAIFMDLGEQPFEGFLKRKRRIDRTVEKFVRNVQGNVDFNHSNFDKSHLSFKDKDGSYIFINEQSNNSRSISSRLRELEKFAIETGGVGVAQRVLMLFPELIANKSPNDIFPNQDQAASTPLPTEAPIKWKDRNPDETPLDFARRIYGPWLRNGMSKRALRSLDATLLNELNKWVREGNEMPSDIRLLTLREENDAILATGGDGLREHLGKFTGAEVIREAARLRGAQERRK